MTPEAKRLFDAIGGEISPEVKKRIEAEYKKRDDQRNAVINTISEQLLGIRQEHSDTIYTQHPLSAGVLREALRRAYDGGGSDCAKGFMETIVKAGLKS